MMKKIFALLYIWISIITPALCQDYASTDIISIQKNRKNIEKLQKMNLDFLMEKDGKIYIVAKVSDLIELQNKQISYSLETFKFPPYISATASIQSGINGAFHSYQEVERELMNMEQSHPQLAKLYILGTSLENRNIYALKISDNVSSEEPESEVIFLGCHHAREWISVEVPLLLGKHLVQNYNTDAEIQTLVDNSEIWIVPIVNPDGLEYSIYFYRYWRKNRRDNKNGTFGVDLNRNYSYKWGFDNRGSSPNPANETYRGPAPFSEPETQALRSFVAEHDFQALITYHNYSQVILYPWGYAAIPPPQEALLKKLAQDMVSYMKAVNNTYYRYGQSGDALYLTNGDTTDWALGVYGIPAFTIELPPIDFLHGGFFNAESEIQTIFAENLPAALYLIRWAVNNFLPETARKRFQGGKGKVHMPEKKH